MILAVDLAIGDLPSRRFFVFGNLLKLDWLAQSNFSTWQLESQDQSIEKSETCPAAKVAQIPETNDFRQRSASLTNGYTERGKLNGLSVLVTQ